MIRFHKFTTDCATDSGEQITDFGTENGQYSQIFCTNELTTIEYATDAMMMLRNAIKAFLT